MTGPAPPELDFALLVSQNRFLPADARELHAILTVTATPAGRQAPAQEIAVPSVGSAPETAVVILVDCSGSMGGGNIVAARRATATAIDTLRDGVLFAVVEGTHVARMVYPPTPELRPAAANTRAEARRAAKRLQANGGTAMGTWLSLARRLLVERPGAIRHAILLTDGYNGESRSELDQVLKTCRDVFVCDARGIGDRWAPEELMRIADVLHGTADAVPEQTELAADFERMIRATMRKLTSDVRLQIITGQGARLRYLKQVFPTQSELTGQLPDPGRQASGGNRPVITFTTGSWGPEIREFHLCLAVDGKGRPRNEDLRAARVELAHAARRAEPVPVLVHWTEDTRLSTVINRQVAHYTGQEKLGRAIEKGCDAIERGDRRTAERELGDAVALAAEQGNQEVLDRLEKLVDVDDIASGRVRLKVDIERSYILTAMTGVRIGARAFGVDPVPPADFPPRSDAPDQICQCGRVSPGAARYCEACGFKFPGASGTGLPVAT